MFGIFTAIMFGTQISAICTDETVSVLFSSSFTNWLVILANGMVAVDEVRSLLHAFGIVILQLVTQACLNDQTLSMVAWTHVVQVCLSRKTLNFRISYVISRPRAIHEFCSSVGETQSSCYTI